MCGVLSSLPAEGCGLERSFDDEGTLSHGDGEGCGSLQDGGVECSSL